MLELVFLVWFYWGKLHTSWCHGENVFIWANLHEKQEHMIGRIFHIKHIKYCMLKISIIFSCVLPLPIFCLFTILHFPTTIVAQWLLRIYLSIKTMKDWYLELINDNINLTEHLSTHQQPRLFSSRRHDFLSCNLTWNCMIFKYVRECKIFEQATKPSCFRNLNF